MDVRKSKPRKNDNIHTTEKGAGYLITSAAATESLEQKRKIFQHVEVKKIQRALQVRIPTNDEQVKHRLRFLGHPICFFAENAAGRRDRLKKILTNMVASGESIPNFKDGSNQLDMSAQELSAHKRKAFWTRGDEASADLRKTLRVHMLKDSLKKAESRLERERKRRKIDKFATNLQVEKLEQSLKTVVSQISIPADTRPLTVVKFSADGKRLATGARTGYAKIWSVHGECQATIKGHSNRISDLVWNINPDSKPAFITGGCDMNMYCWSAEGEKLGAFPQKHENRISKLAWHPCGRTVLSTSFDKTWMLWDVENLKEVCRQPGHTSSVYGVAVHPDGSLCATSDLSGNIRLWDIRKGQHVWGITKHVKQVLSLDFSPKGYFFASGSDDNTISIWDLRKKNTPYSIAAHNKSITCVKFAPGHGNYVMSTSKDCTMKFWNAKRFSLIYTLQAHEDAISGADIAPNSKLMATASFDRTFKLWGPEQLNLDELMKS